MAAAFPSAAGTKVAPHLATGTSLPGLISLGFVLAVVLFPLALGRRGPKPAGPENDDGEGWGRRGPDRPPTPKGGPVGGAPLPDAVQSRIRMRGPGRLSDYRHARVRRPAREPGRRPIRKLTPG